jgi:hypothetical protein
MFTSSLQWKIFERIATKFVCQWSLFTTRLSDRGKTSFSISGKYRACCRLTSSCIAIARESHEFYGQFCGKKLFSNKLRQKSGFPIFYGGSERRAVPHFHSNICDDGKKIISARIRFKFYDLSCDETTDEENEMADVTETVDLLMRFYHFHSSLNIRKGSRTGNSGNNLEFSVLTLRTYVPWLF